MQQHSPFVTMLIPLGSMSSIYTMTDDDVVLSSLSSLAKPLRFSA